MEQKEFNENIAKAKKSIMYVTDRPEIIFEKGEGSYLWDTFNNRYLDMIQGWAVCCLGHCAPVMVQALEEQAKTLINPSPSYYNLPAIQLADELVNSSCMDKVFFINSGAEANEGAIKLARKYGAKYKNGAYEIITAVNGFHGRTLATMSASGKEKWKDIYSPKVDGFKWAEYNDIEAIKQNINENTCAIMLELVQGEAGVIVADKEYVAEIRKLCDENNILLIFDEVQTGMGRTGYMFAYEYYNIEPDIMTLAKGIGGGFPLSALLAKDAVCCFEAGDQGGTYSMTPLGCAVGLSVFKELKNKDICGNVQKMNEYFKGKLAMLMEKYAVMNEIRGLGLLLAIGLKEEIAVEITKECMDKFLLINAPNPKTLRFMPALNISEKEIDECIAILDSVFAKHL
ncbi:acetylornithine/succinylornithine family transaminase [Anaeromicropila populeti]|uniref:Acetylornithine aminotransferase n=1 Tax=Anaeromicropila populeti TaxID=37658 RepID=A0A1I6HSX7_9FIRM|nr:acetylornithine/succinylornithine family transaminase [Anaeromicropila populeti]SFR57507.1 acetylornithine/N-succinyldiaminopimelate aminotransferase [Anaeromicropila populeti]